MLSEPTHAANAEDFISYLLARRSGWRQVGRNAVSCAPRGGEAANSHGRGPRFSLESRDD